MKKVYTSIHFQFSTFVKVDGKNVPIEFKGGMNYGNMVKKGLFVTEDEKIQKAIEDDPRFGWEITQKDKPVASVGRQKLPEKKAEDIKVVDAITDFQSAKDFLRKEYDITHQSLNNPENILKKAEEIGVVFPNLRIENAVE